METYNELKWYDEALDNYRGEVGRQAEGLAAYPDSLDTVDAMMELSAAASAVAVAAKNLKDARGLISTYEVGDQFAAKFLAEYEKMLECEFLAVCEDVTTYIFGAAATEADVNAWAECGWPDRIVRYTDGGGIEFDFSTAADD